MSLSHHRGGSGEPLVLIHGIASRWQAWGRVLPALEERHDVIAIDLPGFGASPLDGTGPSVEAQATRVERFFEELGLDHPHVAGFSMGGAITLELARRHATRSATALAPIGFWTERERAYSQQSLTAAVALSKRLRASVPTLVATRAGRTALFAQTFGRPWRMTPDEALGTIDAACSCTGFESRRDAFNGHRFHDPEELRGVPLTIAWGDRDLLLLFRQAGRARRMLPWARHVTLHGCGHVPFTDDPEQVAEALLAGATAPSPAPVA